jgi:hypothetical protein
MIILHHDLAKLLAPLPNQKPVLYNITLRFLKQLPLPKPVKFLRMNYKNNTSTHSLTP